MMSEALEVLSNDNAEILMSFITKSACERMARQLDLALESDIRDRQTVRREGQQRFGFSRANDPAFHPQFTMPFSLRIPYGTATPEQMAVYEAFAS